MTPGTKRTQKDDTESGGRPAARPLRRYLAPRIVHTESVLPQVMTASTFNDCQSESCGFPDLGC